MSLPTIQFKTSTRLLILVAGIIATTVLVNLFVLGDQVRKHLEQNQYEWMETLSSAMIEGITRDTINGNKLTANELLLNLTEGDKAIEYAYVTDMQGKLFAHSFVGGVPRFIAKNISNHRQTINEERNDHNEHAYKTEIGIIIEYDTPLIVGLDARLHLGLNRSEVSAVLGKVNQSIIGVIVPVGVLAFIIAWFLGRRINRPLVQFTQLMSESRASGIKGLTEIKTSDPDIQLMVDTFQSVIKARDEAEKTAIDREQNLSLTLDSIGDGVIVTDATGSVTRMNTIAEQLTGWQFEEADGLSLDEVFPIVNETTKEKMETPVKKVLSSGETVLLANHTTLISKDGHEYQIADSAAPIRDEQENVLGVILVFHDVSEQYQLREAAAKSRRDLQSIMDNSPAVIYVKDIEGRFSFINKKFTELFHMTHDEIIGKTLQQIFPAEIANEMQQNDEDVLVSGKALESEEQAPHDDGLHTYHSIKFPLRDSENKVYAICGISSDVTARKIQDEQIRRSQKMDALGKLTGGIAHDYNNMMGVILGYAELLEMSLKDQTKESGYLKEIRHAGQRSANLTKKLLTFSRKESSENKIIDLNALLQNSKLMLEKTLTVRIALIYDLGKNLWPIYIDGSDLEDAVLNLSINSMHAIEGGGKLTFKTRNEKLNEKDARYLQMEAGDYVLLSITDTGCGMDDDTKDKIFDPFYTTKGEMGTGLGLSQVYGLIQRSKGSIQVYSELEHGTRVTLYIPRYEGDNQYIDEKNIELVTDVRGNEVILVVDDEPALTRLTSEILSEHGYRTLTANNAKQALKILENEKVDLLLSDVIMPEMDGYELAAVVQEKYPEIKIQLASGFSDDRHVGMLDQVLHHELLHKPYHSRRLLSRMRELLGRD